MNANNNNNGNNGYFRPDGYTNPTHPHVQDEHPRAAQPNDRHPGYAQQQYPAQVIPDPHIIRGNVCPELNVAMNHWNAAVAEDRLQKAQAAASRGYTNQRTGTTQGPACPELGVAMQQWNSAVADDRFRDANRRLQQETGHGAVYTQQPRTYPQQQHANPYPKVKQETGAPAYYPQQQHAPGAYPHVQQGSSGQRTPSSRTGRVKEEDDEAAARRALAGSSSSSHRRK